MLNHFQVHVIHMFSWSNAYCGSNESNAGKLWTCVYGCMPLIKAWLVVSNMNFIFHFIYGIILPIDFHIFQDG